MTIEELLEIEEIKKIRSQYSHFYDANLLDDLVELFTQDAVCEWDASHGGCWIGKSQIRANYERYFKEFGNKEWIVMHAVTNPWIELTGPDHHRRNTRTTHPLRYRYLKRQRGSRV